MASAQVVETSVTNNSPSQDSYHPDDLYQSRYVTPGLKPFPYLIGFYFVISHRSLRSDTRKRVEHMRQVSCVDLVSKDGCFLLYLEVIIKIPTERDREETANHQIIRILCNITFL